MQRRQKNLRIIILIPALWLLVIAIVSGFSQTVPPVQAHEPVNFTRESGPADISATRLITGTPAAAFGRLFPYSADGKQYGYVNILGEFVVEPQFSFAGKFVEGRAIVSVDGEMFGYLNQTGQMIIEPQFSFAAPFSSGLAVVNLAASGSNEAEMAYIDRNGDLRFDGATFQMANDFSQGLAAVRVDDQWGFIDYSGSFAVEPQFEQAGTFAEGLAPVRVGDQYGYIDRAGQMIIEPQFQSANTFSEGLAAISIGDRYGYIDHQGDIFIEPQFEFAANFYEGLALVRQEGQEFYINPTGQTVIEKPDLNFGNDFSEGLAGVVLGGALGFVDHRGELVIPPQFIPPRYIAEALFENGMAQVQTESTWGYVDPNGRWLLELPAPPLSVTLMGAEPVDGDATQVTDYVPPVPEETAAGACFSNTLNSPYAWRCSVGGQIYDPCLIGRDEETLVCGVNPATGAPGLAVELSQPLPEATVSGDQAADIWLFELANGEICGLATGTIDSQQNTYLCSGGSVLFGPVDASGDVWQIERVTPGQDEEGEFVAEDSETVNIVTAWRPADPAAE